MIKSKIVRVKTLAYGNTYDDDPLVDDYGSVSYAQSDLPIVDGGFYEVVVDLYALWNIGGRRDIYNSGLLVDAIDTFGSSSSLACGVHKYYLKRNGATISSAAHPDNPTSSVGLFSPGVTATTYGSAPNVVTVPAASITGAINGSLAFTFDIDGSGNLKIITPVLVTIDVQVGGSSVSNTLIFDVDGATVPNGNYCKTSNIEETTMGIYARVRLNRITQ